MNTFSFSFDYWWKSAQSSLLCDILQATSNKIDRHYSNACCYCDLFILITVTISVLCIVVAITLIIYGTTGLRDYGFANGPLITGIVFFGIGVAFIIVSCIACCR
ncbi:unnamed protein product, partial [Rotaria socialis]